jgi:alpha-N-arabinofuranosidase
MYPLDKDSLKTKEQEIILINGGTDLSKQPVWIEAPHVLKKDGWYYLYCAEGGTGYNHSEVVFRSKSLTGPYLSYPHNPILTQRDQDPARKDPVTSTGHAQLVETAAGEWYAVFLGCRPYDDGHYNTGRETFMTPVQWIDGWPIINPGFKTIQSQYRGPKSVLILPQDQRVCHQSIIFGPL